MVNVNGKKIMAIVAIVALVAILGVCLVACNPSDVSKRLEKKGYSVVTLDENATGVTVKLVYTALKLNENFEAGVFAAKDKESVFVIWFKTEDAAKDFENNAVIKSMTRERVGKTVYAGTEQGVKDAK